MNTEKIKQKALRIEKYIHAVLFPHAAMCPVCKEMRYVNWKYALCERCMAKLEHIKVPASACNVCLSPVGRNGQCNMCKSGKMKSIDRSFAPFCYRDEVRPLVTQFKFNLNTSYMPYLREKILAVLPDRDYDYMVPVPLNEWREVFRGGNQALILAEAVSQDVHIPMLQALKRKGYQRPQTRTAMEKREANVKGIFTCTKDLTGKRILLVDDVRTTGSTAESCAAELKRAGAIKVGLLTIAVVYRDPKKHHGKKIKKIHLPFKSYSHHSDKMRL